MVPVDQETWKRWTESIGADRDGQVARIADHTIENGDQFKIDSQTVSGTVIPKRTGVEVRDEDTMREIQLVDPQIASEKITEQDGDIPVEVRDVGVDWTDRMIRERKLALEDISKISTEVDVGRVQILYTDNPNHVSGSCGEYRNHNQVWVVPDECATRGFSDYRWRVNRTIQGVTLHELGHYLDYQYLQAPEDIFPPETDITNYSDTNSRENFAECFRLWASNPELLEIISPEKAEFIEQYFSTANHGRLSESVAEFNGTVSRQLREASTNEHIRAGLRDCGIDV